MSQDKFLDIFNSADKEIAKNYLEGTISFLAVHLPGLLRQIDSAENKIDENWGKDFSTFEKAVEKWKELFLRGIFKFRQAENKIVPEKKKNISPETVSQKSEKPANIFDIIQGTK